MAVVIIIVRNFYFDIATEQEVSHGQGNRHAEALQTRQEDAGEAKQDTIHFGMPSF